MNVLDLRQGKVEKRSMADGWLAGYALAAILLLAGLGYMAWLDHGCTLNGIMTWHGKVCIN